MAAQSTPTLLLISLPFAYTAMRRMHLSVHQSWAGCCHDESQAGTPAPLTSTLDSNSIYKGESMRTVAGDHLQTQCQVNINKGCHLGHGHALCVAHVMTLVVDRGLAIGTRALTRVRALASAAVGNDRQIGSSMQVKAGKHAQGGASACMVTALLELWGFTLDLSLCSSLRAQAASSPQCQKPVRPGRFTWSTQAHALASGKVSWWIRTHCTCRHLDTD